MDFQAPKWRVHLIYLIIFTILACFTLSYSFKHHKNQDWVFWKAENFADQGGYFIYNPIWFDYGYKSANFPIASDTLLGHGFSLASPIIKDKYTCGVAYLQAPFYLWMKIDAKLNHRSMKINGTQTKRAIDVAGVFYMLLGAICLYFFLVRFFLPFISFTSICLVIVGTNVLYYGVFHPGMSHIYSFFLYSVSLLLADSFFQKKKKWMLILLSLTAACIILIRPINIFFLPCIFFIRGSVKDNLLFFFKPIHLLIMVGVTAMVFAPQMYYWYLISGKLIYYSYTEEGFTHLKDPAVIRVLFAPENGLIPYSIIYILLLIANIYAIIKKQRFAIYYFVYQLIAFYLIASWHAPAFGASYGQRNFVEIFAGLVFPFAFLLTKLSTLKIKIGVATTLLLALVMCFYNLKIMSRYDYAFFGRSPWDWREYKYFVSFANYTQKENFNHYYKPEYITKQGRNSILNINPEQEYSRLLLFDCNQLPDYIKKETISMDIKSDEENLDFFTCIEIVNADTTLLKDLFHTQCNKPHKNKWEHVKLSYSVKKINSFDLSKSKMLVFIWNKNRQKFVIDNVKIRIN